MTTLARSTFLCLVLAALAGCGNPRTADRDESADPIRYQDRETGCMYLTTAQYHTLTPRIAADGITHMGCKGAQP